MPRQSADARAAATFVAGAAPPEPPKYLSKDAVLEWKKIAASKPADWFDAGAQVLLGTFCESTVHAHALAKKIAALRKKGGWDELKTWEKRLALVQRSLATLATKLRLSVQANVEWHSRKLGERGQQQNAKPNRLLGGEAVWGPENKPN